MAPYVTFCINEKVFVAVDPRAIVVASLMISGAEYIYIYAIHTEKPHHVHADGSGERRINSVMDAAKDPAIVWHNISQRSIWRVAFCGRIDVLMHVIRMASKHRCRMVIDIILITAINGNPIVVFVTIVATHIE